MFYTVQDLRDRSYSAKAGKAKSNNNWNEQILAWKEGEKKIRKEVMMEQINKPQQGLWKQHLIKSVKGILSS